MLPGESFLPVIQAGPLNGSYLLNRLLPGWLVSLSQEWGGSPRGSPSSFPSTRCGAF